MLDSVLTIIPVLMGGWLQLHQPHEGAVTWVLVTASSRYQRAIAWALATASFWGLVTASLKP